jgi:hypothetical protein
MNLRDYRFSLKYDYIDLMIVTPTTTNFQTVRRSTGASYVWRIDAGPGGSCTRFCIRIQDPPPWCELEAMVAAIPARTGAVVKVELSLDAVHVASDPGELAALAERMYHFTTRPVSSNQRFGFANVRRASFGTGSRAFNRRRLELGWCLYIGNQGNIPDHSFENRAAGLIKADASSQRIYVKRTNNGAALPPSEWRARFEWTLCREHLPFTTLDEARQVNAVRFASYFKFRRYREDLPELLLHGLKGVEQVGCIKNSQRRVHDRRTRADIELNKRTYDAAKLFVARMNRTPDRHHRCGNFGAANDEHFIKHLDRASHQ